MSEVESTPTASGKGKLALWPTAVMFAFVFVFWVFLYNDLVMFLFWLGITFVAMVDLLCFLSLIVLLKLRKSLSFLIPVLLAAPIWLLLVVAIVAPRFDSVIRPMVKPFEHSRHYVEFLLYNARHHIKAKVRQKGYRYKEWNLLKHSGDFYQIVYDATDEIAKKNDTVQDECYKSVFRVGEHFYFVADACPGFF